ncbi:hypothetical protein FHS83_001682 [Rhizomicrobium palustre]|uniref:Uncharacterized protein n=1 Tax=Rhizomicrobium palustre TaxID=189966 RepID=A0A846MXP6_9PROT|nr:hypothetical protein [Rhizomicrobium palustre]NIK88364.1 hypothetical protein [Rhizomicrobium palustre]
MAGDSFRLFVFHNDAATALIIAESYFNAKGAGRLLLPPCDVPVSKTIYLPIGSSLIGVPWRTRLLTTAEAAYDDNVLFRLNVGGDGKWEQGFPGPRAGFIEDIRFVNNANRDVRAFDLGGGYSLKRVAAENFCQLAHMAPDYVDQVSFEQCLLFWRKPPSSWPARHQQGISSGAFGDGLRIDGCHIMPFVGDKAEGMAEYVGISLSACRGGTIANHINGKIQFTDCAALAVTGGHFELGGLELLRSQIAVKSTIFFNRGLLGRTPIDVLPAPSESCNSLDLEDVRFEILENFGGVVTGADVKLARGSRLTTRGSFRRFGRNGNLSLQCLFGFILADERGFPLPDWISKAAACSMDGSVEADGTISTPITASTPRANALSLRTDNVAGPFTAPSSTYYYTYQLFYDMQRLIGHEVDAAPVSLRLQQGKAGAVLLPSRVVGVTLRVYRGTEPGRYRWMADVPVVAANELYDFGRHLSGFAWQARSPGPTVALSLPGFFGTVSWRGGLVDATARASLASPFPVSGQWRAGDRLSFAHPLRQSDGRDAIGLICSADTQTKVQRADFRLLIAS